MPMDTIDYRIPKVEARVDMLVDNGKTFETDEYVLFLDKLSRYRKGQETVFEFLNQRKEFIPVKKSGTNEINILNQDAIVYVLEKQTVSGAAPPQQKVAIFLAGNIRLDVDYVNPLPDSQSRVLDYLNQESLFLLFYYDERKIFINKKKIIKVKEL